MAQKFHVGTVLSITTGKLMTPTTPPINDVYKILQYMAGEPIWTHQIGRVMKECAPAILRQHPQLFAWRDDVTSENFRDRLVDAVNQFGKFLEIAPLSAEDHESIDPMSELAERQHPDKIITVGI